MSDRGCRIPLTVMAERRVSAVNTAIALLAIPVALAGLVLIGFMLGGPID